MENVRNLFEAPQFETTVAAVPNNDLRYEINKLRSELFAKRHGVQLLWRPAKDRVTIDALREDPTLATKKKSWLQRHDRQCGDLYSMLPLVHGLPMMLSEHQDRSVDRRMMKGTKVLFDQVQLHPEDEKASKDKDTYVLQHMLVAF